MNIKSLGKHLGPGDHPSGSPQSVHSGDENAEIEAEEAQSLLLFEPDKACRWPQRGGRFDSLQKMAARIATLHSIPVLPNWTDPRDGLKRTFHIEWTNRETCSGDYLHDHYGERNEGVRGRIRINRRGLSVQDTQKPEFQEKIVHTFVHEFGHHLDYLLYDFKGRNVLNARKAVFEAIANSKHAKQYEEELTRFRSGSKRALKIQDYHLDKKELWANAYTAWVYNRLGLPFPERPAIPAYSALPEKEDDFGEDVFVEFDRLFELLKDIKNGR